MRKLLMTTLLAISFSGLFAQKLEEVQEKISKGKYDEAKEKIDKFLADPKNQGNANAWYYKGKVYSELARQDSTGKLTYDASGEAFNAFKKYQDMDKKNVLMLLEQNVGLFQLYDLHYNQGIKSYNKKDYVTAYDKMKKAMDLEEYIAKKGYVYNGFSFPALDTQLINLTGSSAYLAKKESEAIPYFEKLADAKLKDKEYREIYALLVEYYSKQNDVAKADKYLAMGKQMFPDNDYWIGLEFGEPGKQYKADIEKMKASLENASTEADKKPIRAQLTPLEDKLTSERFSRYDYMLQKYPDNYALWMDYSIELFNYTYTFEKKPADYTSRQAKTEAALQSTLKLKPNSTLANYVMAQHVYNQIYDMEESLRNVKGATAADLAKKKDINAKLDKKYDELLTYAQKTYDLYAAETSLKTQDKMNMRKMTEALVDYYNRKKMPEKEAFYKDKLKKVQ